MNMKYYSLDELIERIDEPNKTICQHVLAENYELFTRAPAARHNHQNWPGGYIDHLLEVMNLAVVFYESLNTLRPLPFSLSDALLVLYLHDLEKPWKFLPTPQESWSIAPELANKETQVGPFVKKKIEEYRFILTPEHWNGIEYVEGEKNDYNPGKRTQTPLAAFVHLCDTWSARGWYNYPLERQDPWLGAGRSISRPE